MKIARRMRFRKEFILTPYNYFAWEVKMEIFLWSRGLYSIFIPMEVDPTWSVKKFKYLNRMDEAYGSLYMNLRRKHKWLSPFSPILDQNTMFLSPCFIHWGRVTSDKNSILLTLWFFVEYLTQENLLYIIYLQVQKIENHENNGVSKGIYSHTIQLLCTRRKNGDISLM